MLKYKVNQIEPIGFFILLVKYCHVNMFSCIKNYVLQKKNPMKTKKALLSEILFKYKHTNNAWAANYYRTVPLQVQSQIILDDLTLRHILSYLNDIVKKWIYK